MPHTAWIRRTATVHYCHFAFVVAAASSKPCSPHQTKQKMGNVNAACQMTNNSKRNVRVFVTEKALELDAFIALQAGGDDKSWKNLPVLPGDKKFIFKEDTKSDRVLASQNHQVPYVAEHFLSVFVEDEDNQEICSKQIMHNMKLTALFTVLLYDV